MATKTTEQRTVTVTNPFGRDLPGAAQAYYEAGQVHVWDRVAGHYTTCHSLSAGQVEHVKRMASRRAAPACDG